MRQKFKYTTYIARPIEHAKNKGDGVGVSITSKLLENANSYSLLVYDPIIQEKEKVGKKSENQVEYIRNLKRGGKWGLVYDEMWKIWFGDINQNTDLIHLLTNLRMRKHIDGNYKEDIVFWGDAEAVVRSDFIIVYLPNKAKTVGVIYEIMLAFLFRIPIYLIIPDGSKTEANTSLLFGNQISNNGDLKVFYSINDCVQSIRDSYNI